MGKWLRFGDKSKQESSKPSLSENVKNVLLATNVEKEASIFLDRHQDMKLQLDIVGLTLHDLSVAIRMRETVKKHIGRIADTLYESLSQNPDLLRIIEKNSNLERHKGLLKAHLIGMFAGKINDEYIDKRAKIAVTHVRVELQIRWYVAALQVLNYIFNQVIREEYTGEDAFAASQTVAKLLNFEQQAVLHFYEMKIVEQKAVIKQHVSDMVSELSALSQQTNASVQQLVYQTGLVSGNSRDGARLANVAGTCAEQSSTNLSGLLHNISEIRNETEDVARQALELQQHAGQIRGINKLVSDVADQTHLLSLNAAIEAAQAGEHGRGFAVVALEVRKLSEQTKQSVYQITELIEETEMKIRKIAASVASAGKFVEEVQQESFTVGDSFQKIVQSIGENKQMNVQIEADLDGLVATIEEIGTAHSTLAAASDKLDSFMRTL